MPDEERNDFKTRFKKGRSGNPKGRPKKDNNASVSLRDAFLATVRVRDGQGTREVPKIVAALEVCLNNALKGDLKSFVKIMEVVARHKLLDAITGPPPVSLIRRTIVDPKPPPF